MCTAIVPQLRRPSAACFFGFAFCAVLPFADLLFAGFLAAIRSSLSGREKRECADSMVRDHNVVNRAVAGADSASTSA
jgi:hypothetical protein